MAFIGLYFNGGCRMPSLGLKNMILLILAVNCGASIGIFFDSVDKLILGGPFKSSLHLTIIGAEWRSSTAARNTIET